LFSRATHANNSAAVDPETLAFPWRAESPGLSITDAAIEHRRGTNLLRVRKAGGCLKLLLLPGGLIGRVSDYQSMYRKPKPSQVTD